MAKDEKHPGSLAPRVLGFIQEHHLLEGQHPLVVAVSGGADSVCLLHILVGLQLPIKLHIAHLNHQLRGAESEADAQYVACLADGLGIPATVGQRDVKGYQARHHTSLEEAAREVRYTFLAQVAKSIGADRVAVGHTTDDHIETILLHLIRGTGTRGLRGLQPISQWQSAGASLTIVRPLLPVSRQETASYCRDHQLLARIDASNQSLSPLRNRIRQQLLPLLRGYNPRLSEALLRTARIAADELAFLDSETARLWGSLAQEQGDTIVLDKARFLELPAALQRHWLRVAIERLLGGLKDIETRHITAIMAALSKPAGKRFSLPRGLVFAIEYGQFRLGREPMAVSPFPPLKVESVLKIPGTSRLVGWRVQATIIDPSVVKGKPERANAPSETITPLPLEKGKGIKGIGLASNFTAYLDLEKAGKTVLVRCRQPGDRFQPLGMSQPKKLGEFMIDAKIPRSWRQRIPVVCSPEHILWVAGWRLDDRVKVTANTRQVLCLAFEHSSETWQKA